MAIVSSKITRDHDRGNGSRSIFEEHTDDIGKIHERRYHCALDYDANISLDNYAALLPYLLATAEINSMEQKIRKGVDPLTILSVYTTREQRIKIIIETAMQLTSLDAMQVALMSGNVTDTDLDAIFGSTIRTKIRDRAASVVNLKTALDDDAVLTGAI